ncbi:MULTISPECIES: hypothetical protein [Stenotrophomonas]|uniref:hypothetical protein n=1 Tax=Stenotrophomonas TaxID=40323 RepID=UPI001D54AB99|nr:MULTISPECIES: hypothetical protein [Stenotrophomonas]CAH0125348.1 hypothetical protein SRABI122_00049 [Stenotrophomonas lactitubi]CAH0135774.1 hypothetical protein SRABI81_00343 [Stenotrophomonas lactitubi]CAH0146503.1 hypothetical protein SRABI102_00428 [Stenotrophomonas lactitubi]CAH0161502.1 hypothetical protein SRABI66_00972 [Stenotrophomonas lactitubi]
MMKRLCCLPASALLLSLVTLQVQARSIHECIAVPQASIATDMPAGLDEFEQHLWTANTGQVVSKGTDTLLLLRLFSESPGVIDSQQFTKITGSLKGYTPSSEGMPEVVDARLTSGGAGFAHKGDYWLSHSADVELHQPHKGDGRIEVKVTAVGWNSYRKEDRSFYLQFTCQLKEIPFEKLSAWQGGDGNLWRSFGPGR